MERLFTNIYINKLKYMLHEDLVGTKDTLIRLLDVLENIIVTNELETEIVVDEDKGSFTPCEKKPDVKANEWVEIEVKTSMISTEKMAININNILEFKAEKVNGNTKYSVITKSDIKHEIIERSYNILVSRLLEDDQNEST